MKKFYLILASLLGEVVLVLVLLEFYDLWGSRVFWQNLIFLTIAYSLFPISLFMPRYDTKSKEQKWVGMLGLNIAGTLFYTIGTVVAIIFFTWYTPRINANHQLYVLLIILIVFLFSRFFSHVTYDKVGEVYAKEQAMTCGVDSMKKAMDNLYYQLQRLDNVPLDVKNKVSVMRDSMRYFSPVGTEEAVRLEKEIKDIISSLSIYVVNYKLNMNYIKLNVNKMEELLQRRKDLYI